MVLQRTIEQVTQTHFKEQMEEHTRLLLELLKEAIDSKKPSRLWERGSDWDINIDEMEELGWVKTYERRGKLFYRPTPKGIELYQQLVQEGYTFSENL